MWDDEDNNPYGSFHRRDPDEIQSPTEQTPHPSTPPSDHSSQAYKHSNPTTTTNRATDYTDASLSNSHLTAPSKPGGYDSRIEQILYETPNLEIQIVHAGKNTEGGGSYITYTIRTGEIEVRRRYSEFASLRATLVNLHPTLIIPPIPEKHSLSDYAAKPTKAKEDQGIIELRQRMLGTFLNRCRRMQQVREDGVWWRFLDPNVSWSEVLNAHPAASVPKNNLKAPPLDPANPTQAHSYLPTPSTTSKLRSSSTSSASGTPISPATLSSQPLPSAAAHTTPTIHYARFPPPTANLSETDLDPYFSTFESNTKDLETLLTGSMEKTNARLLRHLYSFGEDLMDLGARYNAFSLSEQSSSVAQAIEKTGQACDFTYIQSRDLGSGLSAGFAEPMREGAQFAGVVRGVLRYRVLKRVQEEMTREELDKARGRLDALERSENEVKRMENYLSSSGYGGQSATGQQQKISSTASTQGEEVDRESVDSDFPPFTSTSPYPSNNQPTDAAPRTSADSPGPTTTHQTPTTHHSSSSLTTKLLTRLTHAIQGATDTDPERARRDNLGKTKESLSQLEQALEVAGRDVRDASWGIMADLRRFQGALEEDLGGYLLNFARAHVEWSKRSLEEWEKAKVEVGKIEVR